MSALAATQADGYYIPPSYIESGAYKHQSVSKYTGHKGINQYQTQGIVRFEIPINGMCTNPKCGASIRKGLRVNAKKNHVDDYFTSKIYEFVFNCYECNVECKIRNDPKSCDYLYLGGIRKQIVSGNGEDRMSFDMVGRSVISTNASGTGTGVNQTENSSKSQTTYNPLQNLESKTSQPSQQQSQDPATLITNLTNLSEVSYKYDYTTNSRLRSKYRTSRKDKLARISNGVQLGLVGGGIEVYSESRQERVEGSEAFRREKEKGKMRLMGGVGQSKPVFAGSKIDFNRNSTKRKSAEVKVKAIRADEGNGLKEKRKKTKIKKTKKLEINHLTSTSHVSVGVILAKSNPGSNINGLLSGYDSSSGDES